MVAGLESIFKKGGKAGKCAASERSDVNFHEWRKRVKDLWYSIRLLTPAWPRVMAAFAAELNRLSDLLGDDHDLAMLREHLGNPAISAANSDDFSILRDMVDKRRRELQCAAIELGELVYCEPPQSFVRRVIRYWKTAG